MPKWGAVVLFDQPFRGKGEENNETIGYHTLSRVGDHGSSPLDVTPLNGVVISAPIAFARRSVRARGVDQGGSWLAMQGQRLRRGLLYIPLTCGNVLAGALRGRVSGAAA